MHNNNQPNAKPTNGAAPPRSATKQQAASAPAASGATVPGAARAAAPSPPTPQKQADPPAAPVTPVPPPISAAGKSPSARSAPKGEQYAAGAKTKGDNPATSNPPKRPYCIPAEVSLESFPQGVQAGYREIVARCNEQLVIAEPDAINKALGGVFTADTSLGIVTQHEVLSAKLSGTAEAQELELLLARHDRIVKRQVQVANQLQRRQAALEKKRGLLR